MSLAPIDQPPLAPWEIVSQLHHWLEHPPALLGMDTEGHEYPSCIGFAPTPTSALVINTTNLRGQPYAKDLWEACRAIIESPHIRKVCWQAGHERAFLEWSLGWRMVNYADAMFAWAERWPELRKRLKYAATILTRIPCWTEGISFAADDEESRATGPKLFSYNGADCIATLQIAQHPQLQPASPANPNGLSPTQLSRIALHTQLIEPLNYASQKGIRYDQAAADHLKVQIERQTWEAQAQVDTIAGCTLPKSIIKHCQAKLCKKRESKNACHLASLVFKKSNIAAGEQIRRLLSDGKLSAAKRGELGSLLGTGLNVKSTPAVLACLKRLGLPAITKRSTKTPTANDPDPAPTETKEAAALLTLYLRTGHPILPAILRVVSLRGRRQELARGVGKDGRIRSAYTAGYGTESGRCTSYGWLDGTGGNLQTIPRADLQGCSLPLSTS